MTTPTQPKDDSNETAPQEESSEYRSARRKKIFAGLSFGLVIIMILAITTFVDSHPHKQETQEAQLPASSINGFWTTFCPGYDTIATDLNNFAVKKGESTEKYLDRLSPTLKREAADFRDSALRLNNSSVMMYGNKNQKKTLQELVDVMRESDKTLSERAVYLRSHPITTQKELEDLTAVIQKVYNRYSEAASKATTAIGMGDKKTTESIKKIPECKKLFDQQSKKPTTSTTPSASASTSASTSATSTTTAE